jgi:hypothetical protein
MGAEQSTLNSDAIAAYVGGFGPKYAAAADVLRESDVDEDYVLENDIDELISIFEDEAPLTKAQELKFKTEVKKLIKRRGSTASSSSNLKLSSLTSSSLSSAGGVAVAPDAAAVPSDAAAAPDVAALPDISAGPNAAAVPALVGRANGNGDDDDVEAKLKKLEALGWDALHHACGARSLPDRGSTHALAERLIAAGVADVVAAAPDAAAMPPVVLPTIALEARDAYPWDHLRPADRAEREADFRKQAPSSRPMPPGSPSGSRTMFGPSGCAASSLRRLPTATASSCCRASSCVSTIRRSSS